MHEKNNYFIGIMKINCFNPIKYLFKLFNTKIATCIIGMNLCALIYFFDQICNWQGKFINKIDHYLNPSTFSDFSQQIFYKIEEKL